MALLRWTLPAALALGAVGCGTGLFTVTIEDSKICKTVPNQTFPAATTPGTPETFTENYNYNFGSQIGPGGTFTGKGMDTKVKIINATFTLDPGATQPPDLSFLTNADLQLSGAVVDGGTPNPPTTTVLSYQKIIGSSPGRSITLANGQFVDITSYLDNGTLHVSTVLTGTFPSLPWNADVTVCVDIKATDTYLK